MNHVHQGSDQHAPAIAEAAAEADGRGFGEVAGRAGDLADLKAMTKDLGKHLVVEDEIVGVGRVVYGFEHLARKGPVAGVVFR